MKENRIRPEDVDRIVTYYGDFVQPLCEPLAGRQKPASGLDAKFSIPFSVAVAAVKGNVLIDDFGPVGLHDPKVLDMAQKVEPKYDERLNLTQTTPPGVVEIKTKQGTSYRKEVDKQYGHPQNPLTWEGLKMKFQDCFQHSVKPLPAENVPRIIKLVENLENVSDVSEIMGLLA